MEAHRIFVYLAKIKSGEKMATQRKLFRAHRIVYEYFALLLYLV